MATPVDKAALRQALADINPQAALFDGYDAALVGYLMPQGVAVYSFNALVEVTKALCNNDDEDDAIDYVEFNVLGTLPSMGEHKPLITE